MRIVAFSDVHANLSALEVILDAVKKENPDKIIHLGDIIAKGDKPHECIDLLMKNNVICLAGNCDLYCTRGTDIDSSVSQFKKQFEDFKNSLNSKQREFMFSLPLYYIEQSDKYKILFSHFLIENKDSDYPFYSVSLLNEEERFDRIISDLQYDMIVVGHSHKSFVKDKLVSLCSTGLDYPEYIVIDINEKINYRVVELK